LSRGRFIFDKAGNLVERKTGEPLAAPDRIASPMLVRDVHYKSPLSGKPVTSRSQRREEMKIHEVRELDPSEFTPTYRSKKYAERQRGHHQPIERPKDDAPYERLSRNDLPARLKT
jgi:hypothetical protein